MWGGGGGEGGFMGRMVCGGVVLILVKAVKMHLFQKKLLIFCSGLSIKLAEGCVSVCVCVLMFLMIIVGRYCTRLMLPCSSIGQVNHECPFCYYYV